MVENKQDDCVSGDFVADLKCEIELSAEEVRHSVGFRLRASCLQPWCHIRGRGFLRDATEGGREQEIRIDEIPGKINEKIFS